MIKWGDSLTSSCFIANKKNINEFIPVFERHTVTPIEQTKTRWQAILEHKLSKRMDPSSLSPPLNPSEEGKVLLAVTAFEATNSVFFRIDEK